jgi:hypothetical protein
MGITIRAYLAELSDNLGELHDAYGLQRFVVWADYDCVWCDGDGSVWFELEYRVSKLAVGQLEGLASEGYRISVASGSAFAPAGSILQVVSTMKTDSFTTTSLSFVDVTGFSVSITPKFSSSKILVLVTMTVGSQNTSNAHRAKLLRDSTDIAIGDAAGSRTRVSFQDVTTDVNQQSFSGVHVLDSPNTTSAVTYKIQISSNVSGQTVGVNRSKTDTDAATVGRSVSTITVMEVAG